MNKDILTIIKERHSVRSYKQIPIAEDVRQKINAYLDKLNEESGLNFRLVDNTDKVFHGLMLKFAGWKNPPLAYFALTGEKTPKNEEKCGYYGEKLVLFVQSLGLNTCWVGMFKKKAAADNTIITIAVGYGENNGNERKSKTADEISCYRGNKPEWFSDGVECALLAPTAINRQAFTITGEENRVSITCNNGMFTYIDQGIVRYHFEAGAGKENFEWE